MTERVRKAFRLTVRLAGELVERAKADGITETELVTRALMAYLDGGAREAHAEAHGGAREAHADGETVAALVAQLEVKDRQISRLMDSLDRAQASVQAAQALEGARVTRALEATVEAGTTTDDGGAVSASGAGPLSRLRRWLTGRPE